MGSGEWFAQSAASYRSKVDVFLYRSVEFTGKPLAEVGLRSGCRWNTGRYEVAILGRNIFNRVVAVGGVDLNDLTGFYNQPSQVGAEFVARYWSRRGFTQLWLGERAVR